ncbi:hypothetical protein B7463_g11177, partial [Scytalidium lignicola]
MSLPSKRVVVVTGASRGLGLEWVRQLSLDPNNFIIAVVRSPSKAVQLKDLLGPNIVCVQGDVTDVDSFPAVVDDIKKLGVSKVDLLINNAGIMAGSGASRTIGISKSTVEEWIDQWRVNVIGLVFFTTALIPLLENSDEKRVVNVTSMLGDLGYSVKNPALNFSSYSATKAAVTMANFKFHIEFKEKGFIFLALNPGWVNTDLAGEGTGVYRSPFARRSLLHASSLSFAILSAMAEPMAHDGRFEQSAKGEEYVAPVRTARARRARPSRPLLDWILTHQIEIASTLILPIILLHSVYPPWRSFTRKFLRLSYPTDTEGVYRQGTDDIHFVVAWVVYFTALRATSIEWILRPMATYLGIAKKNNLRFAEQGWMVMYYSVLWTLGMHLWYSSPYWLDNAAIWRTWPTKDMSFGLKWYYLVQLAFWLQQILVIHIEARRKDHYQMLTHHIITCTLVSVAYVYRFGNVANVVLCLMDIVDLVLPIAKILKYLCYQTACDIAFGVFVVTWLISRHIMYLQLCYDIYNGIPGANSMPYGCYAGDPVELLDIPVQPDNFSHLFWPFKLTNEAVCFNTEVKWIFLGMLLMLQALSLVWFTMILRVIAKVMMGGGAEDTRSDDEEDEEEEIENLKNGAIGKRDMDVTDVNVCIGGGSGSSEYDAVGASNSVSRLSSPRPKPTSTRRRLMDAEIRKELLARIGCEKPVQ